MRKLSLWFLALSLTAVTSCGPKELPPLGIVSQAVKDGLGVELRVPRRSLVRGETVPITVTARNLGKKEMVIPATSGALVYVILWRKTAVGWERVKRYPETAVPVASTWRLAPGAAQPFPLNLPIAPDWPVGEPLRLTAELNGRPEVKPGGIIQVYLTCEEAEEATPR